MNWQRNKTLYISAVIISGLFLCAVFAPFLPVHDPMTIDLDNIKQPPGPEFWLGTDSLGRDMLSRILHGARFSLFIGLFSMLISLLIGLVIGLAAGYFGGRVDMFFVVIIDLFLAFPSLLLAIGISILMPPGIFSVTTALCLVGWASFARLFRGMVFSLKENTFVDSARAVGCSDVRIIFVHLLPHLIPISIVAGSLKVGSFILAESALSFLGLGVQPPEPTWGTMVSLNRSYLPSAPWMALFPGFAIALTVFSLNLFGDSLRDMLDQTRGVKISNL